MEDLVNKKIAVLGLGQEGIAVTRYLLRHGLSCDLLDEKDYTLWNTEVQDLATTNHLAVISGPQYLSNLKKYDLVFRSPGIWRLAPELLDAEKAGVEISSQTKWFFKLCPAKIIGVTGTKGKGTTSSLIYEILLLSKKNHTVKLTGNIGKEQPLDFLDELTKDDIIVYELSSFQLQDLDKSPSIAVVLMTTQDHLDKHLDLAEYHESKQNIVLFQNKTDFTIYNNDYDATKKIGQQGNAKKLLVSNNDIPVGVKITDSSLEFVGLKQINPDLEDTFVINTNIVLLRGRHNLENIAAASLASLCSGASFDNLKKGIAEFKGLEHRLALVGIKQGISFYNDSFATVPETTIAAIKSFTEPLILILGGSEKNSDFQNLAKVIIQQENLKALIIIGQTSKRIIKDLEETGQFKGKIFTGAENMVEIFKQVKEVATSGDVVLLSPACASFGMFLDYKDRGKKFIEEANNFEL